MSLKLYFPSNLVEHWVKYESYGIITLISNIGGMLGLMLGASVMTLFAIILVAVNKIATTFIQGAVTTRRKQEKKDSSC